MRGYIGFKARRKKRNLTIFFILIIISFVLFYIMPIFKSNEILPSDTFLPSYDDKSPTLEILTIEDLEFKLFDRDQKIIFRNNEIKKIKEEFKILLKENTQLSNLIQDLSDQLNSTSLNTDEVDNIDTQLEMIKKDNNKKFQILNDTILKITNEKNNLYEAIEKISEESEISKKEYKIIISKNIKLISLKDSFEKKIEEQTAVIDDLNLLIQKLKDSYHHR